MIAPRLNITPPDPISQTMCSIPLCLLYELSIQIVRVIERKQEISG
jgi:Sec-independent protein secretion pathway component TatC